MRRLLFAVVLVACESPAPAPTGTGAAPVGAPTRTDRADDSPSRPAPTVVVSEAEALVAAERARNPEVFADFDRILRSWLDARSPGRDRALLSRRLRSLGAEAVGPMIDLLAVSGFAEPLHATAQTSLQTAVTEALARVDDPRSTPVLRALFEQADTAPVRAAAARGIARSCEEPELALLLEHADPTDPLVDAAATGLGRCLRPRAAERLASLLDGAPDAEPAARIATALGSLASDLVWRAPSRRSDPNRNRIRRVAAESLLRARSRFPNLHEIERSLRMIRHPQLPAVHETPTLEVPNPLGARDVAE